MDDPLIGLTIYDTTSKAQDGKDSSTDVPNDGDRTGKSRIPFRRKYRDNTNEDCFPCLPSIPDDRERVKPVEGSLESSQGVYTRKDDESDMSEPSVEANKSEQGSLPSPSKNFWLMRLFQSSLFEMSIAIGYLFNSKDQSVQSYLGSRLFVSNSNLRISHHKCLW